MEKNILPPDPDAPIIIGFISAERLRNEKICLIEDIFKLVKHIHAFKENRATTAILNNPGATFDELYDLTIPDLENKSFFFSNCLRGLAIDHAEKYKGFTP